MTNSEQSVSERRRSEAREVGARLRSYRTVCPTCGSAEGNWCVDRGIRRFEPHPDRVRALAGAGTLPKESIPGWVGGCVVTAIVEELAALEQ